MNSVRQGGIQAGSETVRVVPRTTASEIYRYKAH
jgi:hypothetical protein